MEKLPRLVGATVSAAAMLLTAFAGTTGAIAAETPEPAAVADEAVVPSLWREYQDYFIMGTFGGWNSEKQLYHYRTSSPANDLKLDSQIGGNWENGNTPTSKAYDAAVQAINADTSLSDEEKAAKLQEANEQIVIKTNTRGEQTLKAVQEYNRVNNLSDEDKKVVRGHVLAWHGGQQPNWFFCNGFRYDAANPDWASPETMLKRLDNYIRAMMENYAKYSDVIYQWDVVNEPVDDYTGQIRNMDDAQQGQWGNIFRRADLDSDPDARLAAESEWVRQAFASARKWSDEYGADWKLYFNDFQDSNKTYEPKLSQTIKVLKPIYEAGNIDGYGMQGRLAWAYPSIDQLKEQIDLGLTVADEIAITESDIRSDFEPNPNYDPSQPVRRVVEGDNEWPEGSCSWALKGNSNGNTFDVCNSPVRRMEAWGTGQNVELAATPEVMKKQADFAADWMDLLISYGDKISAYQWDGTADNNTFNRETGGHLWAGTTGNPEKYSFFAVIGAPARAELRDAIALEPGEADAYTPASWAAYENAKTAAESIVNERVYTLDDVNAVKGATQTLNEAYAGLTEAADLEISATAATRCIAGKIVLTTSARNDDNVPVEFTITSDYGSKVVKNVAPTKYGAAASTIAKTEIPAGTVTVVGTAQVDGEAVQAATTAEYPLTSCK